MSAENIIKELTHMVKMTTELELLEVKSGTCPITKANIVGIPDLFLVGEGDNEVEALKDLIPKYAKYRGIHSFPVHCLSQDLKEQLSGNISPT